MVVAHDLAKQRRVVGLGIEADAADVAQSDCFLYQLRRENRRTALAQQIQTRAGTETPSCLLHELDHVARLSARHAVPQRPFGRGHDEVGFVLVVSSGPDTVR